MHLNESDIDRYSRRGFHLERQLFRPDEVAVMADHYMKRRAEGPKPGDSAGVPARSASSAEDPWKRYPRMIQMHEWDDPTKTWMLDDRLTSIAANLIGQPPVLMQTMVYFKPAGGRGQSFHQDSFYLRLTPIVGSWVALDRADEQTGAMQMVSGSHLLGLLPVRPADTDLSVTDSEVVIPPYLPLERLDMEPGDAVFFHSLTIHGSLPNKSANRFRRAFICHYRGKLSFPLGPPAAES